MSRTWQGWCSGRRLSMQGLAGRAGSGLRSQVALQLHDGIQAAILGIHDDQATLPFSDCDMQQGWGVSAVQKLGLCADNFTSKEVASLIDHEGVDLQES